ncbi:MAG: tRNA glutamyl-Q(34) synthetase GluQRS [Hyphomicrobiaceae bacterium]
MTIAQSSSARPIFRFAPSPTGRLHLGHALSALINRDMARGVAGRMLIRIEDTDVTRCRPEYAQTILEDLEWLGIVSEGPVLRQSEHLDGYRAAASRLAGMGLLYPCFATRQEILAAAVPGVVDPDGAPLYPGLHRGLTPQEIADRKAAGQPFALRLDMARAADRARAIAGETAFAYIEIDGQFSPVRCECNPARWGDVVIQRKETSASYHLAVVVDDARQSISHVVRGADLRAATDIHRLLQVLLGFPEPLYHHHRLLTDRDGRKLSKRDGDTSLTVLRDKGLTPSDIRDLVGLNVDNVLRSFTCL